MMATRRVFICVLSPGSMVRIKSSAVRSAGIAPVRSHQRPSASAAPKMATDSGSTARLSVRSCSAAVTSASIRARYSPIRCAISPPLGSESSWSTRQASPSESRNAKKAWMPARSASGASCADCTALTTAVTSASAAGFMHARNSCSLLP